MVWTLLVVANLLWGSDFRIAFWALITTLPTASTAFIVWVASKVA